MPTSVPPPAAAGSSGTGDAGSGRSGELTTAQRRAARAARREAALAARPAMSPPGPASDRLRVATWNVNSLRPRLAAVGRFLERAAPDVLCLQETRTATLSAEAQATFAGHGYDVVHAGGGSRNGVAVVARHAVTDARSSGELDDDALDREARVASVVVDGPVPLRVVSVYAPHGRTVDHWHYQYKLQFFAALARRVREWMREPGHVVVAGDVNVAATDSDVFHPDAFVGSTHVTGPEREALAQLYACGLVDVDAARWGAHARRFTWWNHGIGYSRNLGMRLDHIAVDEPLARRLDTTWIDHVERGAERPSDHAAVLADFHLERPDAPV